MDLWFFDIDFNCNGDREAEWFDPFSDQIVYEKGGQVNHGQFEL